MSDKIERMDDEELFEIFQKSGDDESFMALYNKYNKSIYAYCLRVTGNREDAQDVFQQVMKQIIEKRDLFKGGKLIAWIMTMTRNFCLMHKRNLKFNEELTESTLITDYHSETDLLLKEEVHKAISKLPEDFREIVELRYLDGFSYEQISEIAGISMALVKTRLYRAKKILVNSLSPLREQI